MSSVVYIRSCGEQDRLIDGNRAVIIFYGSEGCGHCRTIKPLYSQLALKYPNVKFGHVEVTQLQCDNIGDGVPQFVGYRDGKIYRNILGARKEELSKLASDLNQ